MQDRNRMMFKVRFRNYRIISHRIFIIVQKIFCSSLVKCMPVEGSLQPILIMLGERERRNLQLRQSEFIAVNDSVF